MIRSIASGQNLDITSYSREHVSLHLARHRDRPEAAEQAKHGSNWLSCVAELENAQFIRHR